MCLIVDVNVAHKVLWKQNDPNGDFNPVRQGLLPGPQAYITLVYGGKLADEYARHRDLLELLLQLNRAGRARRIPKSQIQAEELCVQNLGLCQSNDYHIIALARVGHVRLLCSDDKALHNDFKNKQLLNNPRGKVYQCAKHESLLRRLCRSRRP